MFKRKPKVYFYRMGPVKAPSRGTQFSAGIDFYIPSYSEEYVVHLEAQSGIRIDKEKKTISIPPHGKILIPSNLKISFDWKKYCFEFGNKSGIALHKRLVVGAFLIDGDYDKELFFNINNISSEWATVEFDSKIIQGKLHRAYYEDFEEVSQEYLLPNSKLKTRNGGFGSTGVK